MPGGMMTSGPTPWWQTTEGKGDALGNLQRSAPPGYKYDPVQMSYVRTPSSTGADVGAMISGLAGAAPPGISSVLDTPIASGTPGGSAYGTSSNPAASAFPTVGFGGGVMTGAGGASGGGGTGTMGLPPTPSLQMPDQSAAISAQYASAKDKVGQESQAALRGLAGAMAGRGVVGSGVEGRGQQNVVMQGQQQMGETDRAIAEQQASLAADFAKTAYQGGITTRGQDIGAEEAQLGAGVTQRGQDIGYSTSQGQLGLGYADLAERQREAALSALRGFNVGVPSVMGLYGGSGTGAPSY